MTTTRPPSDGLATRTQQRGRRAPSPVACLLPHPPASRHDHGQQHRQLAPAGLVGVGVSAQHPAAGDSWARAAAVVNGHRHELLPPRYQLGPQQANHRLTDFRPMNNNTSSLVPFEYEGRQVRVISDELGDPWFVAADLLASLGLDRKALERLDEDEKGVSSIHTPGGEQAMTIVNEPGMYNLVLGSRKKEAHRFKRWVTHEVLPTIRRTGSYTVAGTVPTPASLPSDKQDSVGALLLIGQAIARLPGVKAGIAMAATLNCRRAHLFAECHSAGSKGGHVGPGDEPAPGGMWVADPQCPRRVGAHAAGSGLGRSHALLPPWTQRIPDSLESRRG